MKIHKITDKVFLVIFIILIIVQIIVLSSNDKSSLNPFYDYHSNVGIVAINLLAVAIDISLTIILIKAIKINVEEGIQLLAILVLSIVAASLVWVELWYGSTFYYGEVRDKQGLPLGVNNLGILGSILFTTYFLIKVPFGNISKNKVTIIKAFLIPLNVVLQLALVNLLEVPWNLWQS